MTSAHLVARREQCGVRSTGDVSRLTPPRPTMVVNALSPLVAVAFLFGVARGSVVSAAVLAVPFISTSLYAVLTLRRAVVVDAEHVEVRNCFGSYRFRIDEVTAVRLRTIDGTYHQDRPLGRRWGRSVRWDACELEAGGRRVICEALFTPAEPYPDDRFPSCLRVKVAFLRDVLVGGSGSAG